MSGAPVIAQECVCTRRGRFREKFLFRGGTAANALCIVRCRGFFYVWQGHIYESKLKKCNFNFRR